jgi:hypothetical protein
VVVLHGVYCLQALFFSFIFFCGRGLPMQLFGLFYFVFMGLVWGYCSRGPLLLAHLARKCLIVCNHCGSYGSRSPLYGKDVDTQYTKYITTG